MTRQRKRTLDGKRRVAGEDPSVLVGLLARVGDSLARNPDGTFSAHATFSKDEAPPLVRALMRVEAELLLDDARRLRTPDHVWRTPEQRSVDALCLLSLRCAAALGRPADRGLVERYKTGRGPNTPRGVSSCA